MAPLLSSIDAIPQASSTSTSETTSDTTSEPTAGTVNATTASTTSTSSTDLQDLLVALASCEDETRRGQLEEEIVLRTLDLAEAVARRYAGRGMEPDDLLQVARLALVKAVRRYQPGVGSGFTAFAIPTISGEVKRHFRDCGWLVRPPRRLQEFKAQLAAQEERLLHELRRQPSISDLADALRVPAHEVREAQLSAAAYAAVSLDAPAPGTESRPEPADEAPDEYAAFEMRDALKCALSKLTPRERQLIRLRFVEERTQSEIGQVLGVSQMQVSRLLSGVLGRLRGDLLGDDEQREGLSALGA